MFVKDRSVQNRLDLDRSGQDGSKQIMMLMLKYRSGTAGSGHIRLGQGTTE